MVTLRNDTVDMGGAVIGRRVEYDAEKDSLILRLATYHEAQPIKEDAYLFEPGQHVDHYLKAFDSIWSQLETEFEQVIRQANEYYHVKTNAAPDMANPLSIAFMEGVAGALFALKMPGAEVESGGDGDTYYTGVPLNLRMQCLRKALSRCGGEDGAEFAYTGRSASMTLDRFEEAVMGLQDLSEQARAAYYHTGEYEGSAQIHFGDDDTKDYWWSGGENPDVHEAWRGEEHPDGKEGWRGDQHPEATAKESWSSEDDAPDAEGYRDKCYDDRCDVLFGDYLSRLEAFSSAANGLWLETVQRIEGLNPQPAYAQRLEEMRSSLADAEVAYESLRKSWHSLMMFMNTDG